MWAKKLVVIVGLALLALFGGGEVGVLWVGVLIATACHVASILSPWPKRGAP